jgi:ATP-dependent DNA ligase
MLAADLRDLPSDERRRIWASPDYVAEEKLNGVRVLLHILGSECRLTTRVRSKRTGLYLERTENFPHLRGLPLGFLVGTVLDGELILDRPRLYTGSTWAVGTLSCTMAVCNSSPETAVAIQQRAGRPAAFWAFDLIRDCGKPAELMPFWQRRRRLEAIFAEMVSRGVDLSSLKLVEQVSERKRQFYEALVRDGKEGVMLKHREFLYRHTGRPQQFLAHDRFL